MERIRLPKVSTNVFIAWECLKSEVAFVGLPLGFDGSSRLALRPRIGCWIPSEMRGKRVGTRAVKRRVLRSSSSSQSRSCCGVRTRCKRDGSYPLEFRLFIKVLLKSPQKVRVDQCELCMLCHVHENNGADAGESM
jgi:hypothetical protein